MVGIVSYGAYIPFWRLSREVVAREWGKMSARGEKAVASFDEDSITMAMAAGMDCLSGMDAQTVDGLNLCSTTSPYKEKQAAVIVAAASDFRKDCVTSDYANSLRAGTLGMRSAFDTIKAGSAKKILVSAADSRLGSARSQFELSLGDAAASVLIGDENVIAEVEWTYSEYHEITDVWRNNGAEYVEAWEDRFVFEEGYLNSVGQTLTSALKKNNATPQDFAKAIIPATDFRRQQQMGKMLGFDLKTQIQDGYYNDVGYTGCAHPVLMLAGALEEANAGDRLLLVSYGEGTDVFSLRVTDKIDAVRDCQGVKKNLSSKLMVPDYATYAQWKGLIDTEAGARRPAQEAPSSSAQWRERNQILRLYAGKCNNCGTVQYPPQRVCTRCQTKDDFTTVRLADKKASLFSYALDYISDTPDIPCVICVVNFDGGGRMFCSMADRIVESVEIGMPLKMTFRKLSSFGGIHNYYWKCMPERN